MRFKSALLLILLIFIPLCSGFNRIKIAHVREIDVLDKGTKRKIILQHVFKDDLTEVNSLSKTNFKNMKPFVVPDARQTGNNKETSKKWIARGLLLSVAAFYGTNFGCVKILDDVMNPSVAASLRFTLAGAVFMPYLMNCSNPVIMKGGIEVGVYAAIGYWAQAIALETSQAGTTAFICSLAVIVVPMLDMMFKDKTDVTEASSSSSVSKVEKTLKTQDFCNAVPTASTDKSIANQEAQAATDAVILEQQLSTDSDPNKYFWFAPFIPAMLATVGVGCLELGGTSFPGVGDAWACVQPVMFGLGFWRAEKFMHQSQKEGEPQVGASHAR